MQLYASVSKIDQFRKLQTEDYVTEESFIADIKGESKVGWRAIYGSALHACIEDPARWFKDGRYVYVDERNPGVAPASWPASIVEACHDAWPKPCIWESRIPETVWHVGGHSVTIAGRTDALYGTVIVEGKTKFGLLDLMDYPASLQWQFYLHAQPWAHAVEYRIHVIGGMETGEGGQPHITRNGPYLSAIHAFRLWRQPGIEEKLRSHVEEFVAWAESRKLLGYLRRYEAKA